MYERLFIWCTSRSISIWHTCYCLCVENWGYIVNKQEMIDKLHQAYQLVQEVHTAIEHIPEMAKKHIHVDSEVMAFIYDIEDTESEDLE